MTGPECRTLATSEAPDSSKSLLAGMKDIMVFCMKYGAARPLLVEDRCHSSVCETFVIAWQIVSMH